VSVRNTYNAHGDVVTLLSGGEVIATYSYDAFGNLTGQTGEADNSVLYAGYQYDVETDLYYLNARMYDPVTARFLQADTYAGSQSDPLNLNLYTYCMNNPERYIDPSGHIAIELAVIVISAVVAGMAVEAGIQKFIEKKVCIDYNRIVGEGLFSGAVSAISFGTGNLLKCTIGPLAAKNALSTGTGLTAKTLAAALIANAAGGAASEAAEEMAHQFFVEGRTFSQIDYRQIGISAALGTVVSAGSTLAGAGIDRLKAKRAAGGIVGNAEDMLPARMQLQYFAGEAIEGGNNTKDIYRAVGVDEYYDIMLTKQFRGIEGKTLAAKEFGNDFVETLEFANKSINRDKAAIIKVTIPENIYHMNLDSSIFNSGTPVVEPDMLRLFNDNIINIEHFY